MQVQSFPMPAKVVLLAEHTLCLHCGLVLLTSACNCITNKPTVHFVSSFEARSLLIITASAQFPAYTTYIFAYIPSDITHLGSSCFTRLHECCAKDKKQA